MIYHTKNVRPATDPRFMIFGERSSGTNYLQKLIERNLKKKFSNLIMWKHWMGFTNGGKEITEDLSRVLTVGIIRGPIDWLASMKSTAPHIRHMTNGGWMKFLQSEWWSKHDIPSYGYEVLEDRDFDTRKRYANVLKLRSKKLSWLLDPPLSGPYILIRYEDLKTNAQEVVSTIAQTFSIPMDKVFLNERRDVRYGGNYKPHQHPRPPIEALKVIREQLDWGLEAKVGYEMI